MEVSQVLPTKSSLISPSNNFKSPVQRTMKFDFKRNFSPKQQQVHGAKLFQRRFSEKQPLQPIRMQFDKDPLNLFPLVDRKPGTDSPELVSTPIEKKPDSLFLPSFVIEPLNITDPLNLNDDEIAVKIGRKRKKKRHRTISLGYDDETIDSTLNDSSLLSISNYLISPVREHIKFSKMLEPNVDDSKAVSNFKRKSDFLGISNTSIIIKSPNHQSQSNRKSSIKSDRSASITDTACQSVKFRKKNKKYRHGNFLHNMSIMKQLQDKPISEDRRVQNFKEDWFKSKKCLDVGCGDGYVTHWISMYFSPECILGLDIDSGLINIAKNKTRKSSEEDTSRFPLSFQLNYGSISHGRNVSKDLNTQEKLCFIQEDYVPLSDEVLSTVKPEYDIIILLSVTKWIQLNYGDDGLRRTFKKIFLQLRPGGRLLFEPQTYSCYRKSKNLTFEIRKNFDSMMFMPVDFITYLLSNEVGFVQSLCLAHTRKRKTNNARPMYLLTKGGA